MTLVGRVVARIVDADTPLDRRSVEAAARSGLAEESPLASPDDVQAVVDAVLGLGPLEAFLRDPEVSDVLVDGDGCVTLERHGALEATDVRLGEAELVAGLARTLAALGLRLDQASPSVDARLPDGSRLHAVVPPIAVDGPVVAVRRFTAAVTDLDGLVASGGVSEAGAGLLRRAVADRRTILVTGGTGSGKTTLLNVLSTELPPNERIVCIEDAPELRLGGRVVRLQTRSPNTEGRGEVTIRDLVRSALRLRPDRLIVGEVRGPEALDLVGALNTGHDGSMSTIHANGPEEALLRLEVLAMSGDRQFRAEAIRAQIRSALDLVVQVARTPRGREVVAMVRVGRSQDERVYP